MTNKDEQLELTYAQLTNRAELNYGELASLFSLATSVRPDTGLPYNLPLYKFGLLHGDLKELGNPHIETDTSKGLLGKFNKLLYTSDTACAMGIYLRVADERFAVSTVFKHSQDGDIFEAVMRLKRLDELTPLGLAYKDTSLPIMFSPSALVNFFKTPEYKILANISFGSTKDPNCLIGLKTDQSPSEFTDQHIELIYRLAREYDLFTPSVSIEQAKDWTKEICGILGIALFASSSSVPGVAERIIIPPWEASLEFSDD